MVFIRIYGVSLLALLAGTFVSFAESQGEVLENGKMGSSVPRFDLLRMRYEADEARGFDGSDVELEASQFTVGGFLGKPVDLGSDWKVLSFLNYENTRLDFSQLGEGLPFEDQDLHEVSLHGVFYRQVKGSRWTYGAWGQVSYASDTQGLSGDDFFYDLGLGAGYRVNDSLFAGLAFVGLDIGRDSLYVPGPMVMWSPTDTLRLGVMGPLLLSNWEVSDDWILTVRGAPNGGVWNVSDGGESLDYDLSSYVIRLRSEHRLRDKLWVSFGVGYTFGGDFEVRDSSGDRLYQDDLEGGLSFSVGLHLRAW